nr:AAA family ATPase [Actinomycetota bacterium]
MKPLRLVLQAFGSYAGTLEVDFARMGRHGVFAITGPTGAGKSTIFDAIVYALYGDLPGFRADGNVRSQYADPSTRTRVTLEFEVGGETWTIERAPRQAVPRRRGSGEAVLQAPSALLRRSGEDAGGFSRQSDV